MSLTRDRDWLLPFRTSSSINHPYIKKHMLHSLVCWKPMMNIASMLTLKAQKENPIFLSWSAQAVIFPYFSVCAPALECSEECLSNDLLWILFFFNFLQILLHSQGNMKSLSYLIHRFIQKWSVFYLVERLPSLSKKLFHPRKKLNAANTNCKPPFKPLVRFQLQHWKSNHVSPVYSGV